MCCCSQACSGKLRCALHGTHDTHHEPNAAAIDATDVWRQYETSLSDIPTHLATRPSQCVSSDQASTLEEAAGYVGIES